jgi:hypothetical protein
MMPLEEQSIAQRIILTIVICLIVLFVLFVIGWLIQDEADAQPEFVVTKYEERLLQLETEAIEGAFKKHIMRLYDTWVTDYVPIEPPRAVKGAANARAAYFRSMQRIEERRANLQKN